MKNISIIIPVYNEAENIKSLYQEIIDNITLDENSEIHANSMHENAIPFSNLSLNQCINDFIKNYFTKIANLLYPDRFKKKFDGIHSYVVRYGDNYDRNLGFHVDDSLITINLCLKNDSKGSELCFSGIRCPLHIDTPSMKNEKKIERPYPKKFDIAVPANMKCGKSS